MLLVAGSTATIVNGGKTTLRTWARTPAPRRRTSGAVVDWTRLTAAAGVQQNVASRQHIETAVAIVSVSSLMAFEARDEFSPGQRGERRRSCRIGTFTGIQLDGNGHRSVSRAADRLCFGGWPIPCASEQIAAASVARRSREVHQQRRQRPHFFASSSISWWAKDTTAGRMLTSSTCQGTKLGDPD